MSTPPGMSSPTTLLEFLHRVEVGVPHSGHGGRSPKPKSLSNCSCPFSQTRSYIGIDWFPHFFTITVPTEPHGSIETNHKRFLLTMLTHFTDYLLIRFAFRFLPSLTTEGEPPPH
jgi:hypothetical protein